jgi:hypothetical protein
VSAIDGVLGIVVLLLFLVILGVMREVVILRGEVTALTQLITIPPAPSFLGKRVPNALARKLPSNLAASSIQEPHVVLFLS